MVTIADWRVQLTEKINMKKSIILTFCFSIASIAAGQERIQASPDGDVSLKLEIERAIEKGVSFLKQKQDPETGSWSDPKLPAFTALAISSILGDPSRDLSKPLPAEVGKGL